MSDALVNATLDQRLEISPVKYAKEIYNHIIADQLALPPYTQYSLYKPELGCLYRHKSTDDGHFHLTVCHFVLIVTN